MDDSQYLLLKRKNPTLRKPLLFIRQKSPISRYISSCYHVEENLYDIEFSNKRTRIDITTNWQKKVDDFINNKAK
jgi:hypothetical protein